MNKGLIIIPTFDSAIFNVYYYTWRIMFSFLLLSPFPPSLSFLLFIPLLYLLVYFPFPSFPFFYSFLIPPSPFSLSSPFFSPFPISSPPYPSLPFPLYLAVLLIPSPFIFPISPSTLIFPILDNIDHWLRYYLHYFDLLI